MVTHTARVWINRIKLPILLDEFSSPVLRQPAPLHTQTQSGAHLRDFSRVPRWRPFINLDRHTPSGQSRVCWVMQMRTGWRSLPRVRCHRASKPQCSSKPVLPWPVTMDQLVCASLSHTQYWYEVGMLKVPAMSLSKQYRGYHYIAHSLY